MDDLYFFGAHFLEALAIYITRARPARIWLTLGPREIIIKQIVEDIQPGLPVQMFPPLKQKSRFDGQAAYILSGQTSWFESLVPALLLQQPSILALFCDQPGRVNSFFSHSGIQTRVITCFADLAKQLEALPLTAPEIMLIDGSILSSSGDIRVDWTAERQQNTDQEDE